MRSLERFCLCMTGREPCSARAGDTCFLGYQLAARIQTHFDEPSYPVLQSVLMLFIGLVVS